MSEQNQNLVREQKPPAGGKMGWQNGGGEDRNSSHRILMVYILYESHIVHISAQPCKRGSVVIEVINFSL